MRLGVRLFLGALLFVACPETPSVDDGGAAGGSAGGVVGGGGGGAGGAPVGGGGATTGGGGAGGGATAGGMADAGRVDAGADAGQVDGGLEQDAGTPDAGVAPDAGGLDAGGLDAGPEDAGQDAGTPDAGLDAGRPSVGGCFDSAGALVFAVQADGGIGASARVSTAPPAEDDDRGECVLGGTNGRDVFLHFSLTDAQLVSLSVQGVDGGDPVIYLRGPTCASAPALACADQHGGGERESFNRLRLDAGDYYFVVDNYSHRDNGSYDVTAWLEAPPGAPSNDDCGNPAVLSFMNGTAVVAGDTTGALNDSVLGFPTCSPSAQTSGRDVVYALDVPGPGVADVTLSVQPQTPGFEPVLAVASPAACQGVLLDGGSASLGCVGPPASSLMLNGLAPGRYWVWVDGRSGTAGAFALTATMTTRVGPGSNDLCTGARVLPADGGTRVLDVTRGMRDNSTASCLWGVGNDVYYRFTTAQAQRLTATVTPTGDAGYQPGVYVLPASSCRPDGGLAPAPLAGCAVAGAREEVLPFEISALDAGDWLLVVDGVGASSGPFTLDLDFAPVAGAVGNDTCAAAQPLPLMPTSWGAFTRVVGTTFGATNAHPGDGGCAGGGRDVAYTFTTPDAGPDAGVNVKVTAWSNNVVQGSPVLFLERSCAGPLVACHEPPLGPASVSLRSLPGSTSFVVWVDHADAGAGPFTAQVEVASAPPVNDTCAGAIELSVDMSLAGSTLGANADYRGFSGTGFYAGSSRCTHELASADVVYRFTSTTAGTYVIRVHPDAAFDPGVVVTKACTAGQCVEARDVGLAGDDEVVRLQAQANTTYFIFVDGYSDAALSATARGGFIVSVEAPCGGAYCDTCTTNANCQPGAVCVSGTCRACTSKAECAVSQACVLDACGPCSTPAQCDDGNSCTVLDTCAAGACRSSYPWQPDFTQDSVHNGNNAFLGTYASYHDTSAFTGAGTTGAPGWLQATFPGPVTVAAVTVGGGELQGMSPASGRLNGRLLQYSTDGTTWTDALPPISGVTDDGPARHQRLLLPTPVTARFWRLYAASGGVVTTAWVFEFTDTFCSDTTACTRNSQCTGSARVCTNAGTCQRCTNGSECPGLRGCAQGTCGPCSNDAQCDVGAGCPGYFCNSGVCQAPWQYVATESSYYGGSLGNTPVLHAAYQRLSDNDPTTGAMTGFNNTVPTGFIKATFPTAVTVNAVIVGAGVINGGAVSTQSVLNGRAIQYSLDDVAWTTLVPSISGLSDTPGPSLLRRYPVSPAVTARYWRLQVPAFSYVGAATFAFELADVFACTTTKACADDFDCPAGLPCVSGTCRTCSQTSHCASGGRGACLNGVCLPCTSSGQCGPGMSCDAGICF